MKTQIIWIFFIGLLGIIGILVLSGTVRARLIEYWKYFNPQNLLPISNINITSNGNYTDVIFLHHSTGGNLIREGNLREILTERGYSFWDHGLNSQGIVNPKGKKLNFCYDIPSNELFGIRGNGDTDPDGLHILFKQPVNNPPDNALSRLLQHEIIMFKSCYPNSAIKNDQMLKQYKNWFLDVRYVMDQYPDKIFIPFTIPPLHPLRTNSDEAKRAREWANWLKSPEYLDGHKNIFVFDFFDFLADSSTNMLHIKYQRDPDESDSHPNLDANKTIAPILADFIDKSIKIYKNGKN